MNALRKLLERSLLLRVGVAMAAIILFAVTGMMASSFVAETAQGSGEAIDQAGSLRMQSYRIAALVLRAEQQRDAASWSKVAQAARVFGEHLRAPRLTGSLSSDRQAAVNRAYRAVVQEWSLDLAPTLKHLDAMRPVGVDARGAALLGKMHVFVSHIDVLVKRLAQDTEHKLMMMRAILGMALFLTVAVVFVTMYQLQSDVLTPLRNLLVCAGELGRGNLSVRTPHAGEDELGRLGQTFNMMAEDLSKLYRDLEKRVEDKTADLQRTNRSLELLYHSIARLYNGPVAAQTYALLLHDIEAVIGTGRGTACLVEGDEAHARVLASTMDTSRGDADLCDLSDCTECLGSGAVSVRRLGPHKEHRILAMPLRDADRQHGVLQLEMGSEKAMEDWQMQLLEALCRHIGIAIGTARRAEEGRRLSLLEERSVIARELHDSLAQSLSYMKIQVSRLQALLGPDAGPEPRKVLGELREGLNGAYRQLRELLTTFRLKVSGGGLGAALDATVREFAERGGLEISLDSQMSGCSLSPHEEIHVLQVVREALANVVHHAHADYARVEVQCRGDGTLSVTVDDDGVGIGGKAQVSQHYGMAIMQERARSLGGQLDIMGLRTGGTRVALHFRPRGDRDRQVMHEGHLAI
ncbi:MAG: histidine kinase [Gammaproteobacteria bacterium]